MKTEARPAIDDEVAHRVLVVDDDAGLRDAIGTILETRFEVLTAESGEKALEILRKKKSTSSRSISPCPASAGWRPSRDCAK